MRPVPRALWNRSVLFRAADDGGRGDVDECDEGREEEEDDDKDKGKDATNEERGGCR